jgi:hypothetical protein
LDENILGFQVTLDDPSPVCSSQTVRQSSNTVKHTIKELFLQLDQGEKKYRKAITLITKPLTDGVDETEKQIRDTKKLFPTRTLTISFTLARNTRPARIRPT